MRSIHVVVLVIACLALASAVDVSDSKRVHARKTHVRAALHAKSKSHKAVVHQGASEEASMCKQILTTIFGANVVGASLTSLNDQQALACWCLWSKVTRASALTSAVYRFYNPVPASSISSLAKAFLKAAWKAWRDVNGSGGTNLISRSFMAAFNRSPATMCFDMGDTSSCSMMTDNCKLWECRNAPDRSQWYVSPIGECERRSTLSICTNAGCRPKSTNACPVGDDTMCRCYDGVINTCSCVTRLPAGASRYCDGDIKNLATL